MTTDWTKSLHEIGACPEAIEWASRFSSLETAWAACERGDWMLWYAGRVAGPPGSTSRRPLVLAACACARLSWPQVPDGEIRPRQAIETAEAWARNAQGVKLGDVTSAANAINAVNAANVANVTNAFNISYTAYIAAFAAYYAAYAATFAAYATTTDAAIVVSAAYAAALASFYASGRTNTRQDVLACCAKIVREFYPTPPNGKENK